MCQIGTWQPINVDGAGGKGRDSVWTEIGAHDLGGGLTLEGTKPAVPFFEKEGLWISGLEMQP